jgi:hypothetical protein
MKLQIRAVYTPEEKRWYKDSMVSIELKSDLSLYEFITEAMSALKAFLISLSYDAAWVDESLQDYLDEHYSESSDA